MGVAREFDTRTSLARQIKLDVDKSLSSLVLEADPAELYEPVRYVLSTGGKRLRPMLLLLTAGAMGSDMAKAMPAAIAVEVFHNFTLVHDDIMDDAPERRGRPTVHARWDNGTAILVGDYLLSLSYRLLADSSPRLLPRLLATYHRMVQKLCEGQMLDAAFERRSAVSTGEYLHMVDLKTGALLSACFMMGGILAGADDEQVKSLDDIGTNIGRAFQIMDDLLDLTADDSRWGKKRGGDLIQAKKTYLLTKALESEKTVVRDWFVSVVENGGLDEGKISEAEDLLRSAGILESAASAVEKYSQVAATKLAFFPANEYTDSIANVFEEMRTRLH